jgi:hypothetical protein
MNISCLAPKVSAYNFMRYLCASLTQSKNVIIDMTQAVNKIYSFRQDSGANYKFLFEDIEFRTSVDYVVSYDINEGINSLQTLGIIGKYYPAYEKFVICLTEQEANDILRSCDEFVRNAMARLASTF